MLPSPTARTVAIELRARRCSPQRRGERLLPARRREAALTLGSGRVRHTCNEHRQFMLGLRSGPPRLRSLWGRFESSVSFNFLNRACRLKLPTRTHARLGAETRCPRPSVRGGRRGQRQDTGAPVTPDRSLAARLASLSSLVPARFPSPTTRRMPHAHECALARACQAGLRQGVRRR